MLTEFGAVSLGFFIGSVYASIVSSFIYNRKKKGEK